jgi:carboxylate-amine ligase
MALGIDISLPEENGAQRQKRMLAEGATIEDVYAAEVALTQRTYAAEEVTT